MVRQGRFQRFVQTMRAMGLMRQESLAREGKLGAQVNVGYPEGETPGQSPRQQQINEGRDRMQSLKYQPTEGQKNT